MRRLLRAAFFISIFSFVLVSPVLSEVGEGDLFSKPHRFFEFGIDTNFIFANSSFGLKDVMKEHIEIDLKKISHEMPSSGFKLGFQNSEKVFFDLNLSSRFRFSFFTELESSSHFAISKSLFDLLADGIAVGQSKKVDMTGYSDVFFDVGASFQTIINYFGVKITPTYFIPLVYIPKTKAKASLMTTEGGLIKGEAEADLDIYTAVDMYDFMEDEKSVDNLDLNVAKLLSSGGFDLSFEIERNWIHALNVGLYTRIPVLPGTLKHKMNTRVWAYFYETNALGYLDNTESHEKKHGHDDFTYSGANYKVWRPLRLGLNATYMPFGEWMKIKPRLGFAVREPYSGNAIFYPEYALDFHFSFMRRIFNFNLGTAYQSQIFQHRFGISLNFRMFEIVTQASLCGTDLKASFDRNGYGAMFGVRFGL